MGKKNYQEFYEYECTMTNEKYKVTKKAPNPENLISVQAFYEIKPEAGDRTKNNKKQFETKPE